MILGYQEYEILQLAVEGQGQMTDGCAVYCYDDGKMSSAAYTTGTTEHPDNHLIEVYRLSQGERGEIDCRCWEDGDCPFWIEGEDSYSGCFDEDMIDEYGQDRIECCMNGALEDFPEDDIRMFVEEQIRDIIKDCISDDLSKLHEIHIKFYELFASPVGYQQVIFNDNYEMNIVDNLVDDAVENGFVLVSSKEWLSGDIDHEQMMWDAIANDVADDQLTDAERELAAIVAGKLFDMDLDGVLEVLQ